MESMQHDFRSLTDNICKAVMEFYADPDDPDVLEVVRKLLFLRIQSDMYASNAQIRCSCDGVASALRAFGQGKAEVYRKLIKDSMALIYDAVEIAKRTTSSSTQRPRVRPSACTTPTSLENTGDDVAKRLELEFSQSLSPERETGVCRSARGYGGRPKYKLSLEERRKLFVTFAIDALARDYKLSIKKLITEYCKENQNYTQKAVSYYFSIPKHMEAGPSYLSLTMLKEAASSLQKY
jgi:hypothetical protein